VAKKRIQIVIIIVFVSLCGHLFFTYLSKNYMIGVDNQEYRCLPGKVFLIRIDDQAEFKKGDIIAFYTDEKQSEYFKPGTKMLKMIVGVPGDNISIDEKFIYINGEIKGKILEIDSKGKKIRTKTIINNRPIPKDCYAVMGTNPKSFDSRYWGLICKENKGNIIGKGFKLF